jgi:hypothetical protein
MLDRHQWQRGEAVPVQTRWLHAPDTTSGRLDDPTAALDAVAIVAA